MFGSWLKWKGPVEKDMEEEVEEDLVAAIMGPAQEIKHITILAVDDQGEEKNNKNSL